MLTKGTRLQVGSVYWPTFGYWSLKIPQSDNQVYSAVKLLKFEMFTVLDYSPKTFTKPHQYKILYKDKIYTLEITIFLEDDWTKIC